MSEGQSEAGLEPEPPTDRLMGRRRPPPEGAALLLAIERVGADVAALTRLLAAQPAEVAAHVDIDSATAAIGVRVSALGSNLDQLRLSLLAGLDRATERLDQPVWLPQFQAALSEAARAPTEDVGPALAELVNTVAGLTDGVRAGAAVGDALEHVGQRLAAIEAAAAQVAGDARLLVDRVTPLPDRLGAIAVQIDRLTPLARAGGDVGSLLGQLDRVGERLNVAVDEDERFEAVVDVLAGVTRRQDEVSAAIASVLDQVRGPMGVDAVLDRMEQRERSLAARLDRIDSELRRRVEGPSAFTEASPKPDTETARALRGVLEVVERQERTVAARLDRLDAELRAIADAVPAAGARMAEESESGQVLDSLLDRIEQQDRAISSQLEWVGSRLSEVADHLMPAEPPPVDPSPALLLAAVEAAAANTANLAGLVESTAERLEVRMAAVEDGLGRAEPPPADTGPASLLAAVEAVAANTANLAGLVESTAERLESRLSAVEEGLDASVRASSQPAVRSPSEAEVAALRLAELRAERAHIQARLQEERLLAAQSYDDDAFEDTGLADDAYDDA